MDLLDIHMRRVPSKSALAVNEIAFAFYSIRGGWSGTVLVLVACSVLAALCFLAIVFLVSPAARSIENCVRAVSLAAALITALSIWLKVGVKWRPSFWSLPHNPGTGIIVRCLAGLPIIVVVALLGLAVGGLLVPAAETQWWSWIPSITGSAITYLALSTLLILFGQHIFVFGYLLVVALLVLAQLTNESLGGLTMLGSILGGKLGYSVIMGWGVLNGDMARGGEATLPTLSLEQWLLASAVWGAASAGLLTIAAFSRRP
jgi:hypothetical protein